MVKISAVILAKNEEATIGECIASLDFADEVVVGIDSTTTDDTKKVAKRLGVKTFDVEVKDGFASAKNTLINHATNDWILIIDADERVSPELKQRLADLDVKEEIKGYWINGRNNLLGRFFYHGGWYPDPHIRLVDRRFASYGDKKIHEQMEVRGKVGAINADILHYTHRTIKEVVRRVDQYSDFESEILADSLPSIGLKQFFIAPFKHWWMRMIVKRGYKDGKEGIIEANIQAFYVFLNYAKAWELHKHRKKD
jgi:glycosyltransferase involved in cell wall biosynthesis